MNTVLALATLVIKELYRRKDFYVLFILTALLTLAAGSASFFNNASIIRYLKDLCLMLIWFSALVIAVVTAARQIPAEREQRTIYPLLAKPVTRWQVVLGKFLGCWLACGIALVVFYLFFAVVTGAREHHFPLGGYLQAFWLQWAMLGVITALVLLGSVVFATPAANATICLIIVFGIFLVGGNLNRIADRQAEPMQTVIYVIYFLIPHLEWFDIRKQIVNEMPLPGMVNCLLATLFAMGYAAILLVLTWLGFRRQRLNV